MNEFSSFQFSPFLLLFKNFCRGVGRIEGNRRQCNDQGKVGTDSELVTEDVNSQFCMQG